MESLAFIQHVSSYGGAKFTADGDLKLQLKHPLPHKGTDVRYNVSIKCILQYALCTNYWINFFVRGYDGVEKTTLICNFEICGNEIERK